MSKPPAPRGLLRNAALLCSIGLAAVVVVNAQFGCDGPSETNAPPPATPTATPEPAPAPVPEDEDEPTPDPAPAPGPEVEVEAEPAPPVFMPASKSGGDFGAARFPGQPSGAQQDPSPTQQAPSNANTGPHE